MNYLLETELILRLKAKGFEFKGKKKCGTFKFTKDGKTWGVSLNLHEVDSIVEALTSYTTDGR